MFNPIIIPRPPSGTKYLQPINPIPINTLHKFKNLNLLQKKLRVTNLKYTLVIGVRNKRPNGGRVN